LRPSLCRMLRFILWIPFFPKFIWLAIFRRVLKFTKFT
jgi:hypothetical protein